MSNARKFLWYGILAALVLAAGVKYFLPVREAPSPEPVQDLAPREVVVYITGAVAEPVLLHLEPDARLNDALAQAALLPEADLSALNPAQPLKDGQKVIIPFLPAPVAEGASAEGTPETGPAGESGQAPSGGNAPAPVSAPAASSAGLININTATASELTALPGVGPAIAERIVQYREENGSFSLNEDLMQVSGIGPKTFAKLEARITVGW
ncbi:MAG: helix-hairpin-helix domain-containing protein [Gracilibacteraceae bacterium]|jgi:competence protein ComEA|nr:helix-hairpin-helix domain-containing protein [Gracilibacteraceae bacterium]